MAVLQGVLFHYHAILGGSLFDDGLGIWCQAKLAHNGANTRELEFKDCPCAGICKAASAQGMASSPKFGHGNHLLSSAMERVS